MRWIETDTASNVDISSATAIGAYTADADALIIVDVCVDAVAGNGDYVMYVTKQINGTGSAYKILPKTTMTAASGETAISAQSGIIAVKSGDVLTVYVDGLAGDTTTPDYSTRWFEIDKLVSLADDAITAAKFDESTAFPVKSADTGATAIARVGADSDTLETLSDEIAAVKAETALIVADTGTTGVPLTAAAIDAILDETVEGSYTLRQLLRLLSSTLAERIGRNTGRSFQRPRHLLLRAAGHTIINGLWRL